MKQTNCCLPQQGWKPLGYTYHPPHAFSSSDLLLLLAHYYQGPAWNIREKECAPFWKRQASSVLLPSFSELLVVLYLSVQGQILWPLHLKGCAADKLGRNKTWIHCGGMVAVDTDFHAFCNQILSWAAAVGDSSPKARKRHSLKTWALAFPEDMSFGFFPGQQDLLD